jgi:hypothetical protein
MARLLGLAGVSVAFEEGRRHIREYLQVEVGVNTLREETQLIGARQAQREQAWMKQSQDLQHLQQRERQTGRLHRVYGSIDGAFVPIEKELNLNLRGQQPDQESNFRLRRKRRAKSL